MNFLHKLKSIWRNIKRWFARGNEKMIETVTGEKARIVTHYAPEWLTYTEKVQWVWASHSRTYWKQRGIRNERELSEKCSIK